jgi:hypothetical protein
VIPKVILEKNNQRSLSINEQTTEGDLTDPFLEVIEIPSVLLKFSDAKWIHESTCKSEADWHVGIGSLIEVFTEQDRLTLFYISSLLADYGKPYQKYSFTNPIPENIKRRFQNMKPDILIKKYVYFTKIYNDKFESYEKILCDLFRTAFKNLGPIGANLWILECLATTKERDRITCSPYLPLSFILENAARLLSGKFLLRKRLTTIQEQIVQCEVSYLASQLAQRAKEGYLTQSKEKEHPIPNLTFIKLPNVQKVHEGVPDNQKEFSPDGKPPFWERAGVG